jgi:hypothetical protein
MENEFAPAERAKHTAELLAQGCGAEEPVLLLATAYRKRLVMPSTSIMSEAALRFGELANAQGVSFVDQQHLLWTFQNLCDLLWHRMNDQEQYAWLLQVQK